MSTTSNPEPSHDEPQNEPQDEPQDEPQRPEEMPGVDPDWPQVPGPKPHPGPGR
ncbi:MAG TPA: hypothetical protein VFK41_03585 [Nocardioidaceae bacterium]|nr:hypothetical protein [Nocardioidaceae bacterium]